MDPRARDAWAGARPGRDHVVDTACVAPWVSMEFDPDGWVLACCAGHMYPIGRVGDAPLAEIWGGARVQVLREALASWDLTVACVACRYHLERRRLDPVAAMYDVHTLTDAVPAAPQTMQFALSNRCNLGCVMCNPELSSRLRHDAGLAPIVDRYDDRFFEELAPLTADLRLAKFQGGEPFLIPAHRRVWELLADRPDPPRLLITTNGTVWTDTVEWVLDRFDVDVSISVDAATADTYAAVRRGGDFAVVQANVDRFDRALRARGRGLHVSFCLMDRNAHELAPFLRWAERFDAPASVNLVTDVGLALHDLATADLEAVLARWRTDPAGNGLLTNAGVWATQVAQLEAVLERREVDAAPAPVQPRRWGIEAGWGRSQGGVVPGRETVASEVERLRRWSGGGEVAVYEVGASGELAGMRSAAHGLGLGAGLVGRPVEEVVTALETFDGRPAWLIDEDLDTGAGRRVRVLALSVNAARGTGGSVVRIVELGGGPGSVVLVAADRIQEVRGEPVELRTRRRPDGRSD